MRKNSDKQAGLAKLAERLRDPLQFRIFVTLVMLAVGYMAVYQPLGDRIAQTAAHVKQVKEHENLAHELEDLRAEAARIDARLPKNTDTNEWIEYVLRGIRRQPVTLVNLDTDVPRRVGPFEAIVLKVELRGAYRGLEDFLGWVDTNERFFRVDTLSLAAGRNTDEVEMKVVLLGLKG